MSYFMDPGEMNREISLLRRTTTTNSYNESIESWSVEATLFARRRDMSGSEGLEAGQIVATTKVEWTIYYYEGLNAKDYSIRDERGNTYDITSRPREKGFRKYMEIDTNVRDNNE